MNERIFELIQEQNGFSGLEWSEQTKAEFAQSVLHAVLNELAIMQERYENPDPYVPDEAYYDRMDGKVSAMEDARDHIRWKFDLK